MEKPVDLVSLLDQFESCYETNFKNLQIVHFEPIPADVIDIDKRFFTDLLQIKDTCLEMYTGH